MKLMLILLSITIALTAQLRQKPPNAVYLAYQPIDHGIGIRGDYHINHWAGFYGSGTYGNWGLYKGAGLQNHVKMTAGILIPLKDANYNQHDISVGLNYHYVEEQTGGNIIYTASDIIYEPWSFEVGLTIKMRRVTLGMRTDILRWEPCIDVGIPLHLSKKRKYENRFRGLQHCPPYK